MTAPDFAWRDVLANAELGVIPEREPAPAIDPPPAYRVVSVPEVRTRAPSAPGSRSSEDAADALPIGWLTGERLRVLEWFARQPGPRTRHQCADHLYRDPTSGRLKDSAVGSACGRVNELVAMKLLTEVGRDPHHPKRATLVLSQRGKWTVGGQP